MCTGLTLKTKDGEYLFGRNMDLECNFGQVIAVIPRNFNYINMSDKKTLKTKYAITGMVSMLGDHPSISDAMNEKGLAAGGLNFGDEFGFLNSELIEGKINIPANDIILWILGNFSTLEEVKENLKNVNLMDTLIMKGLPVVYLHWMVADKTGKSIVIESTKDGLKVYDNKVGVLTNAPTFDWHMTNLRLYTNTLPNQVEKVSFDEMDLTPTGRGAGCMGLPGDFTANSRFVRAAFIRHFMMKSDNIELCDFFKILDNVAMPKATSKLNEMGNLVDEITQYSSCMNLNQGVYYYKTYSSNGVNAIKLFNEDLEGKEIKLYKYQDNFDVNYEN